MAVMISVRFPHGAYHATAWHTAPNTGDVEWPPSPWRLTRALLAMWHTLCRDVPEGVLMDVIGALREPPEYWLPMVTSEHTRHYMPQSERSPGASKPVKYLDPLLWIGPDQEILVHWPGVTLDAPARDALAQLVAALPYLGRAESVCDAALLTPEDLVERLGRLKPDDGGWCRPDPKGPTRVLCVGESATREDLEIRPDDMRAKYLVLPAGSIWVSYTEIVRDPDQRRFKDAATSEASTAAAVAASEVTVMRWRLDSSVPVLAVNGLFETDALRAGRLRALEDHGCATTEFTGHMEPRGGAPTPRRFDGHRGAHWLWMEAGAGSDRCFAWSTSTGVGAAASIPSLRETRDLVLWAPAGMTSDQQLQLVRGYKGMSGLFRPKGRHPRGYVPANLHLVGLGSPRDVVPELVDDEAVEWVSATPYLTHRHRKNSVAWPQFIAEDVRLELSRRPDLGPVELEDVQVIEGHYPRNWVSSYKRNRWLVSQESRGERGRPRTTYQTMLRLRLSQAPNGPVSLGALSHFGFGLFVPIRRHGPQPH